MKKITNRSNKIYWAVFVLLTVLASCTKNNLTPGYSTGAPVISSVRTVYKSAVDSSIIYTITYHLNSSGAVVADTVKSINTTPQLSSFDSTVTSGNLNNMYAIIGQNLDGATQVLFNGASAYFNPALGSATSLLVSIPQNAPTGASQINTLTVITTHGSATFKFVVIAPPPTVSGVSDYDFYAGSTITLSGIGFSSVTHIALSGVTDTATIISMVDTLMTIKMPATKANRANLVFTYGGAGTATSTQEFIALDNAYQIFTDDVQNGWADNSWAHPSGTSTAAHKTGTASFVATYPAGGWQIEGLANWYPSIAYDASYKYLSFWVKGGVADHTLTLVGDKMDGGYGQNTSASAFPVLVPAGVWTFYKIPLLAPNAAPSATALNFWKNGTPAQQLGFFLKGQTGDVDETLYFDDIVFVK